MIKQKHSKSELASYYQQLAKEQTGQIRKLERRLEGQAQQITELSQENERLRAEKRSIIDQIDPLREEIDSQIVKISNYKAIIKVKEGKVREMIAI